jgi:ribonuclease VapC
MFVDASAIVAMLTEEPEADSFADALQAASRPVTTPVAIFEATLGLCRKHHASVAEAQQDVLAFLTAANVTVMPITAEDAETALGAFARYGKGRGHPAQLNMGDCFAYAAAQRLGAALLFKGDDFTRTDIRPALAAS